MKDNQVDIVGTVKLDLTSLAEFVKNSNTKPPHPVSNWMSLKSQLQTDGVKALNDLMRDNPDITIEQLKSHSVGLLRDLEMISKRLENNEVRGTNLNFKSEYYKELEKPPNQRSIEYNNFIKQCAELKPSSHIVEAAAAKTLLDLDKPNIKVDEVKANFHASLSEYKQTQGEQTLMDHNRAVIGFKGKDGVAREITIDELKNSKTLGLSGEQREFILTSWQQGLFESGWLTSLPSVRGEKVGQNDLAPVDVKNRTQVFIDASEGVKVYNRVNSQLTDLNAIPEGSEMKRINYVEGTVSVDISKMKGNSFTPGCASVEPKIEIELTKLSPEIAFNLPSKLKTQIVPANSRVGDYVNKHGTEVNLSVIINNSSRSGIATSILDATYGAEKTQDLIKDKTQELVFEKIRDTPGSVQTRHKMIMEQLSRDPKFAENSIHPQDHRRAVELYCKGEKNHLLQEQFAVKRLEGFLSNQNSQTLDAKTTSKITQGVVEICKPICATSKEIKVLEKNAEILVRKCADDVGKKMTWGQAFKRFTDKVPEVIKNLLGKENDLKKLVSQHPEIVQKIKENLAKTSNTNSQNTHTQSKIDKGIGR